MNDRDLGNVYIINNSHGLKIETPGYAGIAFLGDQTSLSISMNNCNAEKAGSLQLSVEFKSIYGGDTVNVQKNFDVNEMPLPYTLSVPIDTRDVGFWEYTISIQADGKQIYETTRAYSVIQKPYDYGRKNADSIMGLWGIVDGEAAQRIGAKHDRVCVYWRLTPKYKGNYDFSTTKEQIERCNANNVEVILALQSDLVWNATENWPGQNPVRVNGISAASQMDYLNPELPFREEFKVFLTQLLDQFGDQIAAVELINEPDGNWKEHGRLTLDQMAQVVAAHMTDSYEIIKNHPKGKIYPVQGLSLLERDYFDMDGSPYDYTKGQKSPSDAIIEEAAKLGKPLMDTLTAHPYPYYTFNVGQDSQPLPEEYLRKLIDGAISYSKKHGFGKIPSGIDSVRNSGANIVLGEMGVLGALFQSTESMTDLHRQHAAYLMKAFVISRSYEEVESIIWFHQWHNLPGDDGVSAFNTFNGGMNGEERYPLPAAMTFAATANMLYKTKLHRIIKPGAKNQYAAYSFTRDGDERSKAEAIAVVWRNRNAALRSIPPIADVRAYDMFGKEMALGGSITITTEPVYFITAKDKVDLLVAHVDNALL